MSEINEKSETPQEEISNSEKKQSPSVNFNYQICTEPDKSKILKISKARCWQPWSRKQCKKRKSQAIKLLQMCSNNTEYVKFKLPENVKVGDKIPIHLEPNIDFDYVVLENDKPGSELTAMIIGNDGNTENSQKNPHKPLKKEDYDIWKDDDFWNKYLAASVIVGVGEGMLEGVANGLSSTSDIAAAGLSGSSDVADIGEGFFSFFDGGKTKRKKRMTKKGRKMRKKRTTKKKKQKKQKKMRNKNKKRKSRKMKRRRSRRKR